MKLNNKLSARLSRPTRPWHGHTSSFHAFQQMLREQKPDQLQPWLQAVVDTGSAALISFANGIRQDFAAVKNALALPWSNGQTEGQVNRLKVIKRQMYGRARFDLLRRRVLATPLRL